MGNRSSAENDVTLSNYSNASMQTQATMENMVTQNIAPGVSYGVVDSLSHSILYRGAVGIMDAVASLPYDDEKTNNAVTSDTLFMAYSVSHIQLLICAGVLCCVIRTYLYLTSHAFIKDF